MIETFKSHFRTLPPPRVKTIWFKAIQSSSFPVIFYVPITEIEIVLDQHICSLNGRENLSYFILNGFYTVRSTIIFLISAMDFAGLSPLGQVFVQFIIVWQR